MVNTRSRAQPNATACSAKPYCRSVDSRFSITCFGEDCRTYTIASRSRCSGSIFEDADRASGTTWGRGTSPGVVERGFSAVFISHLLFFWRRDGLSSDDLAQGQQTLLPDFLGKLLP